MESDIHNLEIDWVIPDQLWERMEAILLADAPPGSTRSERLNWRKALEEIVHRSRSGWPWPDVLHERGDERREQPWLQRWQESGLLQCVWAILQEEAHTLGVNRC